MADMGLPLRGFIRLDSIILKSDVVCTPVKVMRFIFLQVCVEKKCRSSQKWPILIKAQNAFISNRALEYVFTAEKYHLRDGFYKFWECY
jgi:hypothetical protein